MHIPDRDRCNWLRERIETPTLVSKRQQKQLQMAHSKQQNVHSRQQPVGLKQDCALEAAIGAVHAPAFQAYTYATVLPDVLHGVPHGVLRVHAAA
jgi:hypothetical protein